MADKDKTNIVILGSTGSIGQQTLEVIDKHPDIFRVVGLAARDEINILREQIEHYHPLAVAITDQDAYKRLSSTTRPGMKIMQGLEGLCEIASLPEADTVLVAVSGAVGIKPTLAAIAAQKRIALANKETLVAAGDIVMQQIKQNGVSLIPVDSEHSAIFQCINGETEYLKKIWLTASGGPFREFSLNDLQKVTVDMALKHPNWKMGPKITIDSATLMNKGLEVIEAHHLFNVDYNQIEVLVQRESVIHSMVELVDGSFLAHLGAADMRIPIQYALTYPGRMESPAQSLDFFGLTSIHFEKPDMQKFPALSLAYYAGNTGGTMPAVMNAANEVAVNSFMQGKISFTTIANIVEKVMEKHNLIKIPVLEDIFQADEWARQTCKQLIEKEANK
ncbi:MAG: 1-deoxy-D-xylulose-5-phosphate reductoisomerase [Syntrophomonadaceae bacterium]|nr:1-deoxy-D-xylulose-5-phosphate reductoisomerase [Syntrophomonadaceae bacterium]MDD3888639.1 1-deoxy-D-xylulose-5-phosphate reductoisomerase [Syntrophomonadaceae bacterium]MDD4548262.1 1-deoxy-D-xylulose-5-phosphate reductoisomerase [Syntrophomonadaceae bacterium]